MKFKKPIEVQAGISDGDPTNPLGISGYLLSSDGSNVNWVNPGGLSAETAEAIVQPIKANEALVKGDPLYIVGYQLGQDVNIVAKADSSDAAKMPVVGLADDDYASQNFGTMTAFGSFNGDFDTTGGTESWAIGDIIFVKPGGGLTNIKPGGTDLIQNVAIVSRVNSQTGELEVIALGRTNDVPNLPTGRLFVGTAANTSLASDVVYVDDTNDRVGIGTTSPGAKLEVKQAQNNGDTGAFTNTHLKLTSTTATDNTGFVGITAATSGSDNYGYSFGAQRTTGGVGDFKINYHNNSAAGVNRFIIDQIGNVGIGTISPGQKLEVGGNILATGTLEGYNSLVINATSPSSFGNFRVAAGTGGTLISATPGSSNSSTISLGFGINNVEKMRISAGGDVGIRTTNLTTISSAVATLSLGSTVATTSGGIAFQVSGGVVKAYNYVAGGYLYSQTVAGIGQIFFGAGSERMRIHNTTGRIGIGVTNPSFQLQLSTNSAAKPTSNVWTVTSDSRVKENIRDYTTGLEAILKIEPKLYDYNGKAGFEKTKNNIGIIAQDMQKVMPETVNAYNTKLNEDDAEDTELLSFDGHAVTFALINAVKDLKAEIEELKKQINK